MGDNELSKIEQLMTKCNASHAESRIKQDELHLTKVKRAINLRVGLPVGILSTLLILVLTTLYNIGVDNAGTLKAVELQTATLEQQTLSIGSEINTRGMSDEELRNEIKMMNEKLETNFKWLIENGNFKVRGTDYPLPKFKYP